MTKKASGFGFSLPLNSLHVFFSLLSLIVFGLSFYTYFFIYVKDSSKNTLVAVTLLFLISLIFGALGFPKWIEEDKEEQEIRKKKREIEKKKLEKEMERLNKTKIRKSKKRHPKKV